MSNCVTNGCSGACCEAVYFPYTIDQLRRMGIAHREGKKMWTNADGVERKIKHDDIATHDAIADMLIPLGWWAIDPETGKAWLQKWLEDGRSESEHIDYINGSPAFRFNEGHAEGYIVTCKHFDKEKRICNNYENRPGLCKRFGPACRYAGCNYAKIAEGGIVNGNPISII